MFEMLKEIKLVMIMFMLYYEQVITKEYKEVTAKRQ